MSDYLVIDKDDWDETIEFTVKRNSSDSEIEEFCEDNTDNRNTIFHMEISGDLLRKIGKLAKELGIKTK